ncbi:hydrogenase formation protein HypD [Vulcanococcus sp. Clear-D1]|uniref:hydrogenase formation protein HypD n=1 Tax=Vulcanococcus sp. Clear-D1 TaxID=2766970 RepID=UPI0019C34269|nr:hydrogenase formation protein HypD [Vulcanococcus sp. Clear-D1]MBD1195212.1 hydrogenase formation protein HypD [Vulcanococcus sp. Clear-D1]
MSAEARQLLEQIHCHTTRPWTLMEVCGGQTHALLRHGIDQLLPPEITLVHGPGCPVCVTATERIDQALALAERPEVILCSYGDMLRVPGSDGRNLLSLRAQGADVRVIYSPLDVLELARSQLQRQVVFFAVGFETTAPATALLAQQALAEAVGNLKLLVAHVRVVPVLDQLLSDPSCAVQGVLAAGHVCTVMGDSELEDLVQRHRRPVVVTGFSSEELLRGILRCISQLERSEARVDNAFDRAVSKAGNREAQALLKHVFEPINTIWRGLGEINQGGYGLRPAFGQLAMSPHDHQGPAQQASEQASCPSGLVLQGLLRPSACSSFGNRCTPDHPLGAPMVSSEGACAAYYRYQR